MSCTLHPPILLAEQSRWENLSSSLSSGLRGHQIDVGDVVAALLILACVVGVVWLVSRFLPVLGRRGAYAGPTRLFLSLCRAHRLQWREAWWLWQLARFQRLRDPARLFLEPQRWDAASLSPSLLARQRQLIRVRDRVFAESPGGKPQEETRQPQRSDGGKARKKTGRQSRAGTALPPLPVNPTLDAPPWTPPASAGTDPAASGR
jgi:hypothetical protein